MPGPAQNGPPDFNFLKRQMVGRDQSGYGVFGEPEETGRLKALAGVVAHIPHATIHQTRWSAAASVVVLACRTVVFPGQGRCQQFTGIGRAKATGKMILTKESQLLQVQVP